MFVLRNKLKIFDIWQSLDKTMLEIPEAQVI